MCMSSGYTEDDVDTLDTQSTSVSTYTQSDSPPVDTRSDDA